MVPSLRQILTVRRSGSTWNMRRPTRRSKRSTAPASPSIIFLGMAGSAIPRPSSSVVTRASAMASVLPAFRDRTPVAHHVSANSSSAATTNCTKGLAHGRRNTRIEAPSRPRAGARCCSEGDGATTPGARRASLGAEDEVVGPAEVGHPPVHREGMARTAGLAGAFGGAVVVVQERPVPALACAAAVDLALELDPAAVGLDLELPDGRAVAAAVRAVPATPAGRGRRHAGERKDQG